MLEATEKPLYFVAVAVGFFVYRGWLQSVGTVRNDRLDALLGAISAGFIAIISRVSQYFTRCQVRQ
ncbi:hypothetical protein A0257_21895 [Hymenobacter psoromatis]|nr:hypothetical protein A0257_00230 [Hymenobacter psoromatis]AMR27299.1 hypothetical protein A0257_09455 [Hymenobacter psoromatis]AMR28080.1 hypothetical protein A0257_13925 [Hymenobacter psoromatis]AMR28255.1 hypothetical protein A0257_14940 [Hymenobacter psoromatis]AMR28524.1 hypothetical protein A0257_16440 [Hymenobacter psoromatis]